MNDIYNETLQHMDVLVLKQIYYILCEQPNSANRERKINELSKKITFARKNEYLDIMKSYLNQDNNALLSKVTDKEIEPVDVYFLNYIIPGIYLNVVKLLMEKQQYWILSQYTSFSIPQSKNQLVKKWNSKSPNLI